MLVALPNYYIIDNYLLSVNSESSLLVAKNERGINPCFTTVCYTLFQFHVKSVSLSKPATHFIQKSS